MKLRRTKSQLAVLRLLLERQCEPLCGADFMNDAGLFSGTLYPLLDRLEQRGVLKSHWEEVDPSEIGRPRRKFYLLTGVGRTVALALLSEEKVTSGSEAEGDPVR